MTDPLRSEDTKVLAQIRDTASTWEDFYAAQDRLAEVNAPAAAVDGSYGAGRSYYNAERKRIK
jgi:hypothetical protein